MLFFFLVKEYYKNYALRSSISTLELVYMFGSTIVLHVFLSAPDHKTKFSKGDRDYCKKSKIF